MIVSDPRLAAQIVAPDENPVIFDDIGCLRDHLLGSPLAADATIYVADHRTGEWVPADSAVFSRVMSIATPMSSHLVAHVDVESREADSAAHGGDSITTAALFAPADVTRSTSEGVRP